MTEAKIDWLAFCEEWLGTWTGNRPADLLGFYTADAFYLDPAYPAGLIGYEQIAPYFEKLLSRNPEWKWEAVEIFNTDRGFTLKWKATIPVKDSLLVLYGLDIVEMRGRLICRNEVYFDRAKWLDLMKSGGL
jgi:hypothetical protein